MKHLIGSCVLFCFMGQLVAREYIGSGIFWMPSQDKEPKKIRAVIEGSPADKAGLKPGDIVISVNGTNTTNLSVSQCKKLIPSELAAKSVIEVVGFTGQLTNRVVLTCEKLILPEPVSKDKLNNGGTVQSVGQGIKFNAPPLSTNRFD
jgi:C-terminal processing protease CtpA/Prc